MNELDVLLLAISQQSSLTGAWPAERFFCNGIVCGQLDGSGELGVTVQNADLNLMTFASSSISNWYIYDPNEASTQVSALNEVSGSDTILYISFPLDRRLFENLYE